MEKVKKPEFDPSSLKLAQQIAMRMEEDIVSSGWKVGELIGSEAELVARYGASRWVIREAIRITEQDGLVEIRRGRFGGTAVSAPVLDVVGSSIRRFLSVSRVSYAQLYEARSVLENFAAALAAQRLNEESTRLLRELADRAAKAPTEEHLQINFQMLLSILRTAGNSALEVFSYALSQTTTDFALLRGISTSDWNVVATRLIKLRIKLIQAILANDLDRVRELVGKCLKLSVDSLLKLARGQTTPTPLDMHHHPRFDQHNKVIRPKLADQITRQIEYDLVTHDWAPGKLLGSEAELMQRYNVSRSVIREAIRPLERLGVVEMCRGKSSGLKVSTPDPSAIVRSVVLYLTYSKNNDFVSYELRKEIELVVVARLSRAPEATRRQVANLLRQFAGENFRASLAGQRQLVHQFGRVLAESAENIVFSFLLKILAETALITSQRCTLSTADARMAITTVQTEAEKLATAIENGAEAATQQCIEIIWDALRETYERPKRKSRSTLAA